MTTEYSPLYQEITRRIVAEANPVKVILFGSRARGTAHPGSDVDLLVIELNLEKTNLYVCSW